MKQNPRKRAVSLILLFACVLMLFSMNSGCTTYNPYTGQYEPDPAKTMMAVGTAAFAGSVICNEVNHDYHRPPEHGHYHGGPPH